LLIFNFKRGILSHQSLNFINMFPKMFKVEILLRVYVTCIFMSTGDMCSTLSFLKRIKQSTAVV